MITALAARWLLTVVFAAAGPAAAPSWRGPAAAADAAGRQPAVSCVVMCAALTAMTWWSEPAGGTAGIAGCRRRRLPVLQDRIRRANDRLVLNVSAPALGQDTSLSPSVFSAC